MSKGAHVINRNFCVNTNASSAPQKLYYWQLYVVNDLKKKMIFAHEKIMILLSRVQKVLARVCRHAEQSNIIGPLSNVA